MLELYAAVHRHEDVVLALHAAQQIAVLDPRPSARGDRVDEMAGELGGKV
jgi:hypothetical protein